MHTLPIKPEMLLYFYMASCIAVLLFNILYIFLDRGNSRWVGRTKRRIGREILAQDMDAVSGRHLKWMSRKLAYAGNLRAFEAAVKELPDAPSYLGQLRDVFLGLAAHYEKRDEIEQAYFCRIVEQFCVDRGQREFDALIKFLLRKASAGNLTLRENALRALYSIGNEDAVLAAWEQLQKHGIRHNHKLLADGLLRFSGDKLKLARMLFSRRQEFDAYLVLPVMQFIRFFTGSFQEEFLSLALSEREEKELRLEALRYFRRYPYGPAREILVRYVDYRNYLDWEYAAMAALSLSAYPGPETEECLKAGLGASNWYVRLNCAEALVHGLKVPQVELYDIYNGRDRYAREILRYVSQRMEIKDYEMGLMKADA